MVYDENFDAAIPEYLVPKGGNLNRIFVGGGTYLRTISREDYGNRFLDYLRLLNLGIDSSITNDHGNTALEILLFTTNNPAVLGRYSPLNPAELQLREREIVTALVDHEKS